ncbi:M23 family metallopeptidase [Xylanimonas protaetiae]|uniref:M23 family metallopeptidase n=1 Tax=Xylanimonas protaetiae TaxID=2509457 RepID=A0A4P6F0P8_9MICO|nr:M23 family metallopeptidase [Xylanimonas protaetiae]QAY68776.1 M23 family metallopeptidase [Xylanimonas protaetiae]
MRRLLLLVPIATAVLPTLLVGVLAVGLVHAGQTWCTPAPTLTAVPDHLEATTTDGTTVRLDQTQLAHAATIVEVGGRIRGVGRDGLLVALMAGLTESRLRMYANTTTYPASAGFPHDADGADHDSLGIFQVRPTAGWGSVPELMDPAYQVRAFLGGPTGPNHGSPRGLLDIPGWQSLPKGAAAQAVEVSAYPDRYARYEPVAEAILTALTTTPAGDPAPAVAATASTHAPPVTGPPVSETVFPLPAGTWTRTSGFGNRLNPVLHVWRLHAGVDLAAPAGTPILATAAGTVVHAGPLGGLGNAVAITHNSGGQVLVSVYGHIRDHGTHVSVGDQVAAGDWIADVGSSGNSTGPHLHFELRPGGLDHPAIDPTDWLAATHARDTVAALDALPASSPALCSPAPGPATEPTVTKPMAVAA